MSDWRLQNQKKYLKNISLQRKKYQKYAVDWDHGHCEFCSNKFSETLPDTLKEGYSTLDNYYWICDECFDDFYSQCKWKVKEII